MRNLLHCLALGIHDPDVTQVALRDITTKNEHFVATDSAHSAVGSRREVLMRFDRFPFARRQCLILSTKFQSFDRVERAATVNASEDPYAVADGRAAMVFSRFVHWDKLVVSVSRYSVGKGSLRHSLPGSTACHHN